MKIIAVLLASLILFGCSNQESGTVSNEVHQAKPHSRK